VNFFKLLLVLLFVSQVALAQRDDSPKLSRSKVIDDSTKQVYGPNTTRFFYEDNIFFNDFKSQTLDTLIRDFHLYNFVQKLNYEYQDLGNIATAMAPIFYMPPSQIGVTSGWNGFNPYWDSEKVKYYDTKSPYSNLSLVLGGKGRSITDVDYTRNIKPNWNFGFNFRGLFMDKQILRSRRGDRNAVSYYYDAFTTYHTQDSAYWLFANFQRMRHTHLENGGVEVPDSFAIADFFDEFASPNLADPESRDLRTNIHFFHQYRIVNGIEVYHKFDKYRQFFEFDDDQRDEPFYDTLILPTYALDWQLFKTLRNEVGLKGKIGAVFYNGYWAARNYSIDYKWLDEDDFELRTRGTEYYAGGNARVDIGKQITLAGEADFLLSTNYKIKASLTSPWLQASVARYQYKPSYIQQLYLGTHDMWVNNFSNVESTQLFGLATFTNSWLSVSGGGTVTSIDNYIYFKEDKNRKQTVLPTQSSKSFFIQSPEARFKIIAWKKLGLNGRARFTNVSENPDSAIQVPEWFLHGQIAFKDSWFNDNFDFQIGVEAHWQSAYYANGYDVPTQQFYTQRSFRTTSFPVVDAFLNWKMKRGRMFFKYNNIVQAFTKTGYFPTPFYPGQANIFDFGFDWMFFD
jgi:hypothetical protein